MAEGLLNHEELVRGSGGTIVLFHGLLGSTNYFGPLASQPELNNYRVIAIDLLGHGGSPKPVGQENYNLKAHIAAVSDKLDDLELDNMVLAGHSLGGIVASGYTATSSERVKRLLVFGSPLHESVEEGKQIVRHASRANWLMTRPHFAGPHWLSSRLGITYLAGRVAKFDRRVASDARKVTYDSHVGCLNGIIQQPGFLRSSLVQSAENGADIAFVLGESDLWVNGNGRDTLNDLQSDGILTLHEYKGDHHIPYRNPTLASRLII